MAVAIKRIPTGINLRKRMKSYFPRACFRFYSREGGAQRGNPAVPLHLKPKATRD